MPSFPPGHVFLSACHHTPSSALLPSCKFGCFQGLPPVSPGATSHLARKPKCRSPLWSPNSLYYRSLTLYGLCCLHLVSVSFPLPTVSIFSLLWQLDRPLLFPCWLVAALWMQCVVVSVHLPSALFRLLQATETLPSDLRPRSRLHCML